MTSVVTVTVTNQGGSLETFDLAVEVPVGWDSQLEHDEVTLSAYALNTTEVRLFITPPIETTEATYSYTVTASGRAKSLNLAQPAVSVAVGEFNVGTSGVVVSIDPAIRTLLPSDSPTWTVTITNTGSVQHTFALTMTGIAALSGELSQNSETLNAGESATIQLTAADLNYALATTYNFAVAAISQSNAAVRAEAIAYVTFDPDESVMVHLSPGTQTVLAGETAFYILTITNTGNTSTAYDLSVLPLAGSVNLSLAYGSLTIPAHTTAQVLVAASADPGIYDLSGYGGIWNRDD